MREGQNCGERHLGWACSNGKCPSHGSDTGLDKGCRLSHASTKTWASSGRGAVSSLRGMLGLLIALPSATFAQEIFYVHTDSIGSVVAHTNVAATVISRREYEPFGLQITPGIQDGPGYTGHAQDAATGLTYMQQRYYDPQIGLFLSRDPVSPITDPIRQFNRYRYANHNPYSFVDPDGRMGCVASRIAAACQTAIQAGWSTARRIEHADAVISRAERKLESREGGNSFGSFDNAASWFRREFSKHSTFLQLEFGAVSEPLAYNVTGIVRSQFPREFIGGVGMFIDVGSVPDGGAWFHTHPDLNPKTVFFSGGDLITTMDGDASAAYVFFGYPGRQGKKLDAQGARAAGVKPLDSEIHNHVTDFP